MANLSASVGYEAKVLKTTEATREAVIGEIKAAAARMNPGDIFFLTYSGHGSQVPVSAENAASRLRLRPLIVHAGAMKMVPSTPSIGRRPGRSGKRICGIAAVE